MCKCLFLSTFVNTDAICPAQFVVRALTQLNGSPETYHPDHLMSRFQGDDNDVTRQEQQIHGQLLIDSSCITSSQVTDRYFTPLSHASSHCVPTVDCSLINILSNGNMQMHPNVAGGSRVAVLLHSVPEKMHSVSLDDHSCDLVNGDEDIPGMHLCHKSNESTMPLVLSQERDFESHQLPTIPEEQNCLITSLPGVRSDCDRNGVYLSSDNAALVSVHDTASSSYCESSATSTASSDPMTTGPASCYFVDESTMVIIDITLYLLAPLVFTVHLHSRG